MAATAAARDVPVSTASALRTAIDDAAAGDVILVADGTYDIDANLRCDAPGTEAAPIVVRSVTPLGAHIRSSAVEGFVVSAPYWRFEGLDMEGVCADHSDCEHAWHLVGGADATVIRGNRVHAFNAHIKSNGEGAPRAWPDDVVVEDNELFNPGPRMTSNPVTPIDVVGGRRWILRGNFIHDHQKGMGDGVSYAAFLKGNGRDGVIEGNLVVCELLHTGGTRLGLSFGGGGSGPGNICEDGTCEPEHQGGVMRNNVVVHCPNDVGVYVNECAGCLVAHNTLVDTTGIDVRFVDSDVAVAGNLLSGRVRMRDGATLVSTGNREMVTDAELTTWFVDANAYDFTLRDGAEIVDRGTPLSEVTDDFCHNDRDDGMPDLGAVEYDGDGPCDTTAPGGRLIPPPGDAGPGVSGRDASTAVGDAGDPATTGGGCGCRAARSSGAGAGSIALLVFLALRRARRGRSGSRAGEVTRVPGARPADHSRRRTE